MKAKLSHGKNGNGILMTAIFKADGCSRRKKEVYYVHGSYVREILQQEKAIVVMRGLRQIVLLERKLKIGN